MEIFNCDCIELIESGYLKDKNICIVTDPPFNIGYHYKSYKDKLKSDEYYVKMAQAWLIRVALVKCYEYTLPYITEQKFDKWVHNKGIQKAVESYRISNGQKTYLKSLKIR